MRAWFSVALVLELAGFEAAAQDAPKLFEQRCALCHGGDGSGSDRGPALARSRQVRGRSRDEIRNIIRNGTQGGMPPFALQDSELQALTDFVAAMNAAAFDSKPDGDAAAGERFFLGPGRCASCHPASAPDLSNIGRQFTTAELIRKLRKPSERIAEGYGIVTLRQRDGKSVRGFSHRESLHSLQLRTLDGRLLLLEAGSFEIVSRERASAMPALNATADEERDLVAYLARLGGVSVRALASETPVGPVETAPGEWPTYNGSVSGNRHSPIDQITTANVARLAPQWSYTIPHFGLQSTPLVAGGIMYVSGPNQVHAIDARTGEPVWRYTRPRSSNPNVAGDAAKGANRGVALLGDWIFYTTDDAHLLCLNRWTGALRWQVYMPEQPQHYGATAAPLIAGDLVIAGVAGADEGIRGFVAAYRASTGSLAWRFWTVPRAGEPGSETWRGNAIELGGGSTWLTGSYDPESRIVYWPTGNPYPDTEGSEREGDNLFTNCILALDLATGKLRWHFQFTPHDLHDWDAVQPAVLVDTEFQGKPRKLLLHADRNGFFYVLDRTNGALLLAKPFAKKITWASSIGQDGRPVLLPGNVPTPEGTATCPDIRGATNWMATAYNPATRLYYLMTIENCGIYRSTDFGGGRGTNAVKRAGFDRGGNFFQVPGAEPPRRYLRAIEIQTGRVVWEIDQQVPAPNYGGVLSTAGGVVFYSESSGAFAAVDAKTGRALWHFQTGQAPTASPMTYVLDGRQYVAICAGANVWVFALPKL